MTEITVVIVTCNRQAMLEELMIRLDGLSGCVNVIVGDDSQYEGYHRVARYNEGVAKVETPFVVLMDDDCIPVERNWADTHVRLLMECDVVRGLFEDSGKRSLTPWFSSNNLSMKTDLAKQLGPFDMAYDGRYGYEDIDLELSLKKVGASIITGSSDTAIIHRGVPDHSYHTGLEENKRYYCRKWNIPYE